MNTAIYIGFVRNSAVACNIWNISWDRTKINCDPLCILHQICKICVC